MWHDGGLHRVVAGREVRIEPVAGGVDVEPGDDGIAREVGWLLGLPVDLDAFWEWAARGHRARRRCVSRSRATGLRSRPIRGRCS